MKTPNKIKSAATNAKFNKCSGAACNRKVKNAPIIDRIKKAITVNKATKKR